MAAKPTTGETWLANPIAIEAPAAAAASGNWDEYSEWFEVGARADTRIVAVYSFMSGVTLFEEDADGSLTWIANPFPADPAGLHEGDIVGVAKDAERCYESLALPTVVPLVDGAEGHLEHLTWQTKPWSDGDAEQRVRALGASALYRVVGSSLTPDDFAAVPPMTLVSYRIKTPFSGWIYPGFAPLAGLSGMTNAASLSDYFDGGCGDTPGFEALVPQTSDADWTVVGTSGGRDVAIPTASNPYAIERYDAYVQMISYSGASLDAAMSFEEYLALPGLVALRADEGGWWVGLNTEVSPRMWC